jgi:hypothetical protein
MNIGVGLLLLDYLLRIFKNGQILLILSIYLLEELNSHGVMVGVALDTLNVDWIELYAIKLGWILVVSLQSLVSSSLDLITFLYCLISN